jgi:transposase
LKKHNNNRRTARPLWDIAPGTLTVGLDVSDHDTHAAVIGANGELLAEERVRTRTPAMESWLRRLPASLVVLETGTHARWIAQLAERCGHEVIVANPRHLRLIYAGTNKSDRLDAIKLARVGRLDRGLLAEVELRKPEEHADLAVITARDTLVQVRTQLINLVRGTVKAAGARVDVCSSPAFTGKANQVLPAELRPALGPVLEQIDALNDQIQEYDERLEHLARTKYPETELLRQIGGVGFVTALTFRLTIGDARRFRRSREVGCYVGLRPKRDQSGAYDPQLGITKAGNGLLRRTLVNAAHYIVGPFGPDCDLRRWGLALAGRNIKAAKTRAVVAVARKLAVLLHRLWANGEVYEPLRNSRRRERAVA